MGYSKIRNFVCISKHILEAIQSPLQGALCMGHEAITYLSSVPRLKMKP